VSAAPTRRVLLLGLAAAVAAAAAACGRKGAPVPPSQAEQRGDERDQ
jgi:hypothetical protein